MPSDAKLFRESGKPSGQLHLKSVKPQTMLKRAHQVDILRYRGCESAQYIVQAGESHTLELRLGGQGSLRTLAKPKCDCPGKAC